MHKNTNYSLRAWLSMLASATSLGSLIIMGGGALAQIGFGMLEQSLSFRGAYIVIPVCITISLLLDS